MGLGRGQWGGGSQITLFHQLNSTDGSERREQILFHSPSSLLWLSRGQKWLARETEKTCSSCIILMLDLTLCLSLSGIREAASHARLLPSLPPSPLTIFIRSQLGKDIYTLYDLCSHTEIRRDKIYRNNITRLLPDIPAHQMKPPSHPQISLLP